MSQETPIADIVSFLETDLTDVIHVLQRPDVFEVMLNPYKCQNGQYEGHLWYEAAGVGMKRLTNTKKHDLHAYPKPTKGDLIVIKTINDGETVLNYQILPRDQNFYKVLKLALCYTLKEDEQEILYLDQEEYYRLNEFGSYIQTGNYGYKDPIAKNATIDEIIDKINNVYLDRLDITFKLQVFEYEDETMQLPQPKYSISKEFLKVDFTRAEQIIGILASANEKKAHKYEPIVEVQIPYYGHRFTGILPPVAKFPFFAIRKHSSTVKKLEEYVSDGVMPQKAANILIEWVKRGNNILVGGSVGSGKTTLLNTLLRLASIYTPNDRVGIIEDTPEIQNVIENSYAIATTDEINISRLLRVAFRLSSTRLVVGEIRGAEAYVFLKAMSGGFTGCMASIHADGAAHALYRFEQCLTESNEVERINRIQIASSIRGIVSIQKVTLFKEVNGIRQATIKRRVTAIREITGYDPRHDIYEDLWVYKDPEAFMLTGDGQTVNNEEDFAEFAKKEGIPID